VSETIVDRIRGLVRQAVKDGKFRSANHFWSPEEEGGCGLSRAFLANLKFRLKTDPDTMVTFESADKIARALGLPTSTVTGRDESQTPTDDPYPNRARAISAARDLQLSEAAILVIRGEDHGWDLPRIAWFLRIQAEEARLAPAAYG
jgi:hypothetical protein